MKKRILIILPFFPWPLVSGGHQAIFNGIRAVASFADVHLVYYAGQKDDSAKYHSDFKQAVGGDVTIHPYVDKVRKWTKDMAFRKVSNKVLKRVDYAAYFINAIKLHDAAYYDFVNALIRENRIDLVQAEMMSTLDFVLTLPEQVKKVFVHHELCFVRNQQYLDRSCENSYLKALCEKEKIDEIALLNRYDMVMTLSESDRVKLLDAGVLSPVFSSFGIVNTKYANAPSSSAGTHSLVYVGPEAHYPNKMGLKWFLDNVWERVKDRDSAFKMDIIGQWSDATKADWTRRYPDLAFRGFVEDLPSALTGSTMVVPILVGSGIRMKILEAMSIGVPFVSTVVGAEGIPAEDGVHGFITDDPAVLADDIIRAEDPQLRKRFIENGRKLIQDHFSEEALAENKREAYKQLLED